MKIVIDIPDEQIEKSLAESKYIHENEGEKGSVNIVLLYTNKKLEFVDVSRKTDFYSLTDKYTVLPKGHGDLIDRDNLREDFKASKKISFAERMDISCIVDHSPTIIEADSVGLVCNIFDEMNRDEQMLQVFNKSLCNSCITKGCMFQSGIVRNHCDFYKAESEE